MKQHLEKQPRVTVVGAGYWGKNLVRNFANLGALAMVCDPGPASCANANKICPGVKTCAVFEDVLTVPDIDAVAIATPAVSHYAQAKAALLAGKDVFVEKPLALEVAEGRELIDLAA